MLTAGAALEQERDHSFNVCATALGDCTTPPIDTARWNGAFYAQMVATVAGRVSVTAGARLEDNQRFGTYVTYRAGAAYRLPDGTRVRATAGTGFREPTFIENYPTGYSVGNPDLKPEHSRSWEVGLEHSLAGGRASLLDSKHVVEGRKRNSDTRQQVVNMLSSLGYEVVPSQANFFMVNIRRNVKPVIGALRDRGVHVGRVFPALPQHLRVTVGTPDEMQAFVAAFRSVMT